MKNDSNFIVHLEDVTKIFGTNSNSTIAVKNISLKASQSELVLILGPSGSGKTTLLTLIAGLLKPSSGIISLFENNIEGYSSKELQDIRAQRIGFVFQNFLLIDSLTVIENITLVLRFAERKRMNAINDAHKLLSQLHIDHLWKKFPNEISHGEKQRVAIARAIANDAQLIIADEPTASLETKLGFEIIQLLHQYAKECNKCVIVASHDLRIAEYADRVFHLDDGRIMNDPF